MVGQVVHCTRGLAERLALLPKAHWGGVIHLWEGALLPNTHKGAICLLNHRCWGAAQGQGGALVSSAPHGLVVCRLGPYAVPSLWQGSITEFLPLLTECRGPLQLHTQAHSQGNSNSWSLTAPGSGVGGAGAYTRSGPATHTHTQTHTHTHTHTRPLCQRGARASHPCVPPLALQHLSLPTLGQMHGYRGPAFLGLTELCTDAQQSLCAWQHGTQDTHVVARTQHTGTPRIILVAHPSLLPTHVQYSSLWTHSPASLGIPAHSTQQSDTISDTMTPWDHTQLQNAARDPPQPAAPGHAAHRL